MLNTNLTETQIKELHAFQKSWIPIALNTAPLEYNKVQSTIDKHYKFLKIKTPKVVILPSPKQCIGLIAFLNGLASEKRKQYIKELPEYTEFASFNHPNVKKESVSSHDWGQLEAMWLSFCKFVWPISPEITKKEKDIINLWEESVRNLFIWYAFDEIAIVSERFTEVYLDAEYKLHKDGSKAIRFKDDTGLYAWHGTTVPKKYGSVLSEHWKPEWILEEDNAELRKILTETIGYDRVLKTLGGKTLDTWREYELIEFSKAKTREPIHLLKMTCPSTRFSHTIPVPEEIDSAREAIKWCNWGIDAATFITEA